MGEVGERSEPGGGSYSDGTDPSGVVRLKGDHDMNLERRDVLVVEGILDSDPTLELKDKSVIELRVAAKLCSDTAPGGLLGGTEQS